MFEYYQSSSNLTKRVFQIAMLLFFCIMAAAVFVAETSPVKVKQEILDDEEDSKVTDIGTPSSYGKPAGKQNQQT